MEKYLNQSRTNGPIKVHLTIAQVMPKYNHNNEKQEPLLLKFRQNIFSSTVINSTTKLFNFVNAINMYVTSIYFFFRNRLFFENSLVILPPQPIKLRDPTKVL